MYCDGASCMSQSCVSQMCMCERCEEFESFKLPKSELELERIHQIFNICMYSF